MAAPNKNDMPASLLEEHEESVDEIPKTLDDGIDDLHTKTKVSFGRGDIPCPASIFAQGDVEKLLLGKKQNTAPIHQEPSGRQHSVAPSGKSSDDQPVPGIKDDDTVQQLRFIHHFASHQDGLLSGTRGLEVQESFIHAQDWLTDSNDRMAFLEVAAALVLHTDRIGYIRDERVGEKDVILARSLAQRYIAEGQQMTMGALGPWLMSNIRTEIHERICKQVQSLQKAMNKKRQSGNDEGGSDLKNSRVDSQEE